MAVCRGVSFALEGRGGGGGKDAAGVVAAGFEADSVVDARSGGEASGSFSWGCSWPLFSRCLFLVLRFGGTAVVFAGADVRFSGSLAVGGSCLELISSS